MLVHCISHKVYLEISNTQFAIKLKNNLRFKVSFFNYALVFKYSGYNVPF